MTRRQEIHKLLHRMVKIRRELVQLQIDMDFEESRPGFPPLPLNSPAKRAKRANQLAGMDQMIQTARDMLAGRRPLGPLPVSYLLDE